MKLTVKGFAAGEAVQVGWSHDGSTFVSVGAVVHASSVGSATISRAVPDATTGDHLVQVTGESTATQTATFTVQPKLALNVTSGAVGSHLTMTAKGYAANETVTFNWAGVALTTATSNAVGTAVVTVDVPEVPGNTYQVDAVGASATASASYTVVPSIKLSKTGGRVGISVVATLHGFGANEATELDWYTDSSNFVALVTDPASLTTDANGSAVATFTTPNSVFGGHNVKANSASSHASAAFSIQRWMTLTPVTGPTGTSAHVILTGFPQGTVQMRWVTTGLADVALPTATVSANGRAAVDFDVPDNAAIGNHEVQSYDNITIYFRKTFTVTAGSTPASCNLSAASGNVGSTTTVSCTGFQIGERVNICWDGTAACTAFFNANASGAGSVSFTIPEGISGNHSIVAVGVTSTLQASQTFSITPSVTLSATTVKPGDSFTATLKGYAGNEAVSLSWSTDGTTFTALGSATTTSATGTKAITVTIPDAVAGARTLRINSATTAVTTRNITLAPKVTLGASSGVVGHAVTVTLKGYGAGESIDIKWGSTTLATVVADSTGDAFKSVNVPETAGGSYTVSGVGTTNSASASFLIQPSMGLSSTLGAVGSSVTITLKGYGASQAVAMKWYTGVAGVALTTTPSTVTTNANGSATATFVVPQAVNGSHKVEGKSATATASVFYTVKYNMVLTPVSGPIGTTVSVDLTGFKSGESISIRWTVGGTTTTIVATTTVAANGHATATFAVPAGATVGSHKVEAVFGTSSRTSQLFTVTAS